MGLSAKVRAGILSVVAAPAEAAVVANVSTAVWVKRIRI